MKNKSKVVTITHDEWINELFPKQESIPEGAFTIREIAEKTGLSYSAIGRKVYVEYTNGKLKRVKALNNGKTIYYYYKPK